MSFALFQIPEVQQLVAYLEGNDGDLSGHVQDVPRDDWMDDENMLNQTEMIKEKVNFCLRAAYNDYHNVAPEYTPESLSVIGDAIVLDLVIDARNQLQCHAATLRRAGYIVSTLSYPLVVSNAGDTLIEVTEHGDL